MADPLSSSNPLTYLSLGLNSAAGASIRALGAAGSVARNAAAAAGGAVAGAGGAIAGAVGLRGRVANLPPGRPTEGQQPLASGLPPPDFEDDMYNIPPEEVVQAEMKAEREKKGAPEVSSDRPQSPALQSSDSSDSSGSDFSPKLQALDEGEKKIHGEFSLRPSTITPPLLPPAQLQPGVPQVELPKEPKIEPLKGPKRYTWVNLLAAISGIAALIFGIMSQSLLFGIAGAALLAYGVIFKHSSGSSQGKEVLNS